MKMFDELMKYGNQGHFYFGLKEELGKVCTAPKDAVGVYLVYAVSDARKRLIYVGSSGKMLKNGSLKIRKGGLYARIVDGKQLGSARKSSWPEKMLEEKIETLDIYWYVTFDQTNRDIPGYVEGVIIQKYYEQSGQLPEWNVEF